jgi:hypothetical protein
MCEVDRPMPSSTTSLTVLFDPRFTAGVGSRSSPFPVARSIDEATRDGDLHLVDGDGASLCEAFTQQQLRRLPQTWAEAVDVARCRVCDLLGSWSARA